MADDKAGGLHCPNCGHVQEMGWDDPESWIEGKFDWDFNLPLEGMAEGDELLEPGERNWVVPTRNFGPRHVGGMEEWDTTIPYEEEPLYHGARSRRDAESIRQRGLTRGYLSSAPEEALQYASEHPEHITQHRVRFERPLHLSGDPLSSDYYGGATGGLLTGKTQDEARAAGYDGIVVHRPPTRENPMEPSQEWGEHRHVIPLDWATVQPPTGEKVRTGSTRSLYHGTLLDHLPSIQQHGLIPEVGPFVSDAYDLDEPSNWMAFSPEEVGVEPVTFMTDKKRLGKALNAMQFNVSRKLNKTFGQVTPLDVRNHGLLLKHKGEMGAQDPPMNYVWDEQHEEPFEEGPRAHQPRGVAGEGPFQAEPGDYYSKDPVGGLEYLHGAALMRFLKNQGLWHGHPESWNIHPEGWQEPAAAQEVYGAWRFSMPVTPQYWQQRPKDFALYHGTSPKHLESIMQHGLHPFDSDVGPGTNYAETPRGGPSWLTPRPGHVYLSQNPRDAHDRGINADIGGLPPGTNVEEYLNKPIVFRVDPRMLDPQHVNPDEDFMLSGGGKVNNQEEHPEYESLGEMAERFGWGDVPSDTERVLGQGKSIGYRGVIPPEALTPGKYGPGGWAPLERTSSWRFQAAKNPRKFMTTAQDHERGKRRWGFPKPRAHTSAVDPEWLQKWVEVNGPYMTHQTDSEATRQRIEKEGLIPHDQGPGSQYDGTLVPRANHSYLARNLKALSAYSKLGEGSLKNSTVAIDLRKLDPDRINPDEDAFDPNAFFREGDKSELRGQLPQDVAWPKETRTDEPGFPGVHGVVDTNGNRYTNGGEWADKNNVSAPHHTAWSMNTMGHAAIEGGVHPEAIVPVDAARADLEQNWPQVHLPEDYGASHKVVPIAQPAEAQRAASLIGEMRDGWGRFASGGVPWEYGKWGKGIYYPNTGTVLSWGDDRTHPEVALEDENFVRGDGHHFVIRPNGTVKDQGAMNSNFESVEGDVPGLAEALRSLDPRLRLDKPSDWDFGPTEPMEEEPSSVSRGEDGGQIHDVQTANDFAGSL